MSLASALESAASALPELSEAVRPANGDPVKLLANLDEEGASRVLAWLLTNDSAAGEELAAAFVDEPAGAAALLALRDADLPKSGRKVLRRVLHRLRSRGETVSESPTPRVGRLAPLEDPLGGAYVSALDPSGARLVVLLEPHPSGGARLFEIVADEARGVLDFHAFETGRSKARSFVRELQSRERLGVVEIPREAAEALLARVSTAGGTAAPPRAFATWRGRLASPPPEARSPGELVAEALGTPEGREPIERAVALVRERAIGPWPPAVELLEELAASLKEAAEGRVIVSGVARRERVAAALADCTARVFAGEAAAQTAHRLRESAFVLWKRDRIEDARACLAAAAGFEAGEVEHHPVARALVELLLEPALKALADEDDPSLLVKGESGLIAKP